MDHIFAEAKRLYDLGFAILWLHPKSKRPVENKWTTGPRKSWDVLHLSYREGYNVGVRTGTPSKLENGYLACIDVDIKDPACKEEALKKLKDLTSGAQFPSVLSGSGNGSRHLYCATKEPFKMVTVKKEKGWEICIYSDGRQMVLPPSIHPDTGNAYKWAVPFSKAPLFSVRSASNEGSKEKGVSERPKISLDGFKVETVELDWLPVISDEMRKAITTGERVTDRSAFLLKACRALSSAGLSQNAVLSVLTDPKLFLGQTGYDHAKTASRKRAADWVYRYTFAKIEKERTPPSLFSEAPIKPRKLTKEEMEKDSQDFREERDWRQDLVKTSKGESLKPCFMNALMILENEFGVTLFHKDDFSLRRTYGMDTPWGGTIGKELSDEDLTAIRRYIGENYRMELEEKHVVSAVTSISSRNHHHPVREYLDSLVWDGVPRLDTWLKDYASVDAPDKYLRAISRKVLCAMVTRAYRPGAKFDYVLILEGPNQGEGKSRSIRALATPDWAGTVRFDMDHKDFVLALQGRWATEISELSGLGKKNTAFVKAIVSEESDRIRHPYGRFTETLPRQGIFIGTTNHFQYLEDETGNRRFWPVRVGPKIDVDGLEKARDQLFAEAKVYYEKGEPLYLENPDVERLARQVQTSRMSEDSWEEKISSFFMRESEKALKDRDIDESKFKILDLFGSKGPLRDSIDSEPNLRRACRACRRLGYAPKDMKGDRGHGKYWTK